MKKLLTTITVLLLSLASKGQQSPVGTWMMDGGLSSKTSIYGKWYMPTGKLYGYCLNVVSDNMSTWLLGDYDVEGDSVIHEHLFFHTTIAYQRDISFNYRMETDSTMTTTYTDILPNGERRMVSEQWSKMPTVLTDWLKDSIEELYQQECEKAPIEFGRKPSGNKTVEEMGRELFDNYQRQMKSGQLDRAYETILIRAEMDTTNMRWQADVLDFYTQTNTAPSMAEKITNRYIRLAEQQAASPTDTSVVDAYVQQAIVYSKRGNNGLEETRKSVDKAIALEELSNRPPRKNTGMSYYLKALTYMSDGKWDEMYDYAKKAYGTIVKAPGTSLMDRGEALFFMSIPLLQQKKYADAIGCLKQSVPLFVDSVGKQIPKVEAQIYPLMFLTYGLWHKNSQEAKKLEKEYLEFMSDKLFCVDMTGVPNEWGLKGKYYVMERDNWNMDSSYAFSNEDQSYRLVLQKDGNHVTITLPKGQSLNGAMCMAVVDKKWRNQVLKNWKSYKRK